MRKFREIAAGRTAKRKVKIVGRRTEEKLGRRLSVGRGYTNPFIVDSHNLY